MTKELQEAHEMVGAFLKWFELAIFDIVEGYHIANFTFWQRHKVWKEIKKLKKAHKICAKDLKALLKAAESIDDCEGSEERAEAVKRMSRSMLVNSQIKFKPIQQMIATMRVSSVRRKHARD